MESVKDSQAFNRPSYDRNMVGFGFQVSSIKFQIFPLLFPLLRSLSGLTVSTQRALCVQKLILSLWKQKSCPKKTASSNILIHIFGKENWSTEIYHCQRDDGLSVINEFPAPTSPTFLFSDSSYSPPYPALTLSVWDMYSQPPVPC